MTELDFCKEHPGNWSPSCAACRAVREHYIAEHGEWSLGNTGQPDISAAMPLVVKEGATGLLRDTPPSALDVSTPVPTREDCCAPDLPVDQICYSCATRRRVSTPLPRGEPTRRGIMLQALDHAIEAASRFAGDESHDEAARNEAAFDMILLARIASDLPALLDSRDRVAALEADAKRLDWLEENALELFTISAGETCDAVWEVLLNDPPSGPNPTGRGVRSAIDAAMSEPREAGRELKAEVAERIEAGVELGHNPRAIACSLRDVIPRAEPTRDKPTVPDVLPLVRAYYALPGNGVGGSLHIVLDDGNVEDSSVTHCLNWAREKGDEPGIRLAEKLLLMSRTQRKKLYMAPK